MEAMDLYLRCEEILCNCKQLFNYYERYRNCLSVRCLDEEMNSVLRKMALSYSSLMTDVSREVFVHSIVNNLVIVKADDYIETIGDNNTLFIDQICGLMRVYKDNILEMLTDANAVAQTIYLNNFENAFNDAHQIIKRMELLIRNSQQIGQLYLKATA